MPNWVHSMVSIKDCYTCNFLTARLQAKQYNLTISRWVAAFCSPSSSNYFSALKYLGKIHFCLKHLGSFYFLDWILTDKEKTITALSPWREQDILVELDRQYIPTEGMEWDGISKVLGSRLYMVWLEDIG